MTIFTNLPTPDPFYEAARNALIHKAEVKANRNFGKTFKKGDTKASLKWAAQWNAAFHREMERLVTAAGLKSK